MNIIDPNAPTQKEIAELKLRMMKGNLAMDLARGLVNNPGFAQLLNEKFHDSDGVALFCIGLSESILDKFMSIEGNGGLIS